MPRKKTWPDDAPGEDFAATAVATAELIADADDPLALVDELIRAEQSRSPRYVDDPHGTHFIMADGGRGWGLHCEPGWPQGRPAYDGEDCPHCGSRAVIDAAGRCVGYLPGSVQESVVADAAGNPVRVATESTCAHCHRSGLDSRINVDQVREAGRIRYLESLRAAELERRGGESFASRHHKLHPGDS